jgi:hypothetical protein
MTSVASTGPGFYMDATGEFAFKGEDGKGFTFDGDNFVFVGSLTQQNLSSELLEELEGEKGDPGDNAKYILVDGEQAFKYTVGQSESVSDSITLTSTRVGGLATGK